MLYFVDIIGRYSILASSTCSNEKKRKGADFFDISDTLVDGHMRYVEIVCISKFSQCHSFKSITKMASLLSGPGCSDAHLENIFAPKVFQVTRNSC